MTAADAAPARPGVLATPAAPAPEACGGFVVGDLALALPIATLREVVPAPVFEALPCDAPALVGGCRLRGSLIPVVDLRRLFGCPPADAALRPRVLVLRHEGRLLGLRVDAVTGVFTPAPDSERQVQFGTAPGSDHRAGSCYAGTVRRPEDDRLVNLLSAPALLALPGMPVTLDPDVALAPQPGPVRTAGDAIDAGAALAAEPMMLLHCGGARLAIAAMAVHAAVPVVDVRPSPLQGELCVGVIEHDGRDIAAVDLLALLGLGRLTDQRCERACLVRIGDGMVALLANDVIDVMPLDRQRLVRVPRFVLPKPGLVAGALPIDELPQTVLERMGSAAGQFLVLDPDGLRADPLLAGLARVTGVEASRTAGRGRVSGAPAAGPRTTSASASASAREAGSAGPAIEGRSMMVYALHTDVATPVEQVAEVLPYHPCGTAYAAQRSMLGLMAHRGRAIPVMCLCALTGSEPPQDVTQACVLVVHQDGEWIGFAVPRLRAIETARWEPNPARDDGTGRTPPLAMIGHGSDERMVPVIDLQRLARELRGACTSSLADAA